MRQKRLASLMLLAGGTYFGLKHRKPLESVVLGNLPQYSPRYQKNDPFSPLRGKKIVFLGSSITAGMGALNNSFTDYLAASDGINAIKLAKSGTTLAGEDKNTYVNRLLSDLSTSEKLDLFVCQLSTNDSRAGKAIGAISSSYDMNDFDINTTIGAIEFIIGYVKKNWAVPIVFYTCLRKPDVDYENLMDQLKKLQAKWHFSIIDLWGNESLKLKLKANKYTMVDDAHPTMLGYRDMWTPIFRKELKEIL